MNPVDEYIRSFPVEVQSRLAAMRKTILDHAPDAVELMSYGMPAYKTHGKPLVYFAAFKQHIGFYATPSGHQEFSEELAGYKQGKGSVQFPLDKELPLDLISRIVCFRVEENNRKAKK